MDTIARRRAFQQRESAATAKEEVQLNISNERRMPGHAPTSLRTLALLLVFRVINALWVATFWVPDEYFQSLEIAHVLVFKYGIVTWEWRGAELRGFAHPLVFAAGYWVLAQFNVDHTELMIVLPRIMQALVAALADYYSWRLAVVVMPNKPAKCTLAVSCLSWYNAFTATRTLANSMESAFFVAALFYWTTRRYTKSIVLMGCCVLLRPTALLLLFIHMLISTAWPRPSTRILNLVVPRLLTIGSLFLAASVLIDYWGYSHIRTAFSIYQPSLDWMKLPIVALNFLQFNVKHKISDFYGTHPWHWYFTNGWPTLLGPYTLIVVPGLVMNWRWAVQQWWIMLATGATVLYSFIPHKEFRFLASVLPLAHLGVGLIVAYLMALPSAPRAHMLRNLYTGRIVVFIITISCATLASYFARIHQSGALSSMKLIRHMAMQGNLTSVYQLMPCHSTPMYSYVHQPVRLGWITCEPPLGIPDPAQYEDETGLFYKNISGALESWNWSERWGTTRSRVAGTFQFNESDPADLVMVFDSLWQLYWSVGILTGYNECGRTFNSHWHDDDKRRGDIVLLCRKRLFETDPGKIDL